MTRDEHGRLRLDCKLGTYYHSLSTSECLDAEPGPPFQPRPSDVRGGVGPGRICLAQLHERVPDPVADGRHRSAAIGVSTLTVVRVRNRSFDGYKMFLSPRSVTVATQRRRYHVVPSGMFQPFIPGESADLLQEQFSVAATAVREFVEKLYGVHELETAMAASTPMRSTAAGRPSSSMACSRPAMRPCCTPAWPSTCSPCATKSARCWSSRTPAGTSASGELRICDEFLQQCEQAELLPDQRWVQLISLTRPGLEVEPMWWDRLRASTIVAPGAAAVELGLQVARAVVS
jgi:hypothetical protein